MTGQTRDGHGFLRIYVQPRSSRNKICGIHGDALKIAVTAPPVDGKANGIIVAFLAKYFGVSKKTVMISSGAKSRTKTVVFKSLNKEELAARLSGSL